MYAHMCTDAMHGGALWHGGVETWVHIYRHVRTICTGLLYDCQGKSRWMTGLCWPSCLVCIHPGEAVKSCMVVHCCDHGWCLQPGERSHLVVDPTLLESHLI